MSVEGGAVKSQRKFNPQFCRTVLGIGAVVCALITAGEINLVLTIDPPATRCPGWIIPGNDSSRSVWIWGLVVLAAAWTLIISYYAVTWRRFAQMISGRIDIAERTGVSRDGFFLRSGWQGWKEFNANNVRKINFNGLLVTVVIASALIAAVPLFALAAACF